MVITDIQFKAIARIEKYRSNDNIPYIVNKPIKLVKDTWDYCITHVPFTLYIELEHDEFNEAEKKIFSIQHINLNQNTELLIMLNGRLPELNSDFNQTHWYTIPTDLSWDSFHGIHVDITKKSTDWIGWDKFESY